METKIIVLSGDKETIKITFSKENPSFIFLILGDGDVFYLDTTSGKLWRTKMDDVRSGKCEEILSESHIISISNA